MNPRTVAIWSVLAWTLSCGGQAGDSDQAEDVPPAIPSDREPTRVAPRVPIVPEEVVTDDADPVGDEPATLPPADRNLRLQQAASLVLDAKCGSCHGAAAIANGNVQGGLDCIADFDCLVQTGYVRPADTPGSLLVQRMRDGTMPPAGVQPLLHEDDIAQVEAYLDTSNFWFGRP